MRRFAAKVMKAKVDDTDVVRINPVYYERGRKANWDLEGDSGSKHPIFRKTLSMINMKVMKQMVNPLREEDQRLARLV